METQGLSELDASTVAQSSLDALVCAGEIARDTVAAATEAAGSILRNAYPAACAIYETSQNTVELGEQIAAPVVAAAADSPFVSAACEGPAAAVDRVRPVAGAAVDTAERSLARASEAVAPAAEATFQAGWQLGQRTMGAVAAARG